MAVKEKRQSASLNIFNHGHHNKNFQNHILVSDIILYKECLELLQYCSLQQFKLNTQLLQKDVNYIFTNDQQTGQILNRISLEQNDAMQHRGDKNSAAFRN